MDAAMTADIRKAFTRNGAEKDYGSVQTAPPYVALK